MFDINQIKNLLYFGIITKFIYDFLIFILSPIIKTRIELSSEYDENMTDYFLEEIRKTHWFSTSKLKTIRCEYPTGLTIGKWYISCVEAYPSNSNYRTGPMFRISIYSIGSFKDDKDKKIDNVDNEDKENITKIESNNEDIIIYRRKSTFIASEYSTTNLKFNNRFCTTEQNKIVEYIISNCNTSFTNNFNFGGVFLITGSPGQGKSVIGRILAQKLNCYLCDDFELTSPGYSLDTLLKTVEPNKDTPLILLIDEYDKSVNRIYKEDVENHKWHTQPMKNKDTHNKFFDRLQDYDNIITLLTSNRSYDWFISIDKSFVRPGRINFHIEINSEIVNFNLLNNENDIASKVNKFRFSKSFLNNKKNT